MRKSTAGRLTYFRIIQDNFTMLSKDYLTYSPYRETKIHSSRALSMGLNDLDIDIERNHSVTQSHSVSQKPRTVK